MAQLLRVGAYGRALVALKDQVSADGVGDRISFQLGCCYSELDDLSADALEHFNLYSARLGGTDKNGAWTPPDPVELHSTHRQRWVHLMAGEFERFLCLEKVAKASAAKVMETRLLPLMQIKGRQDIDDTAYSWDKLALQLYTEGRFYSAVRAAKECLALVNTQTEYFLHAIHYANLTNDAALLRTWAKRVLQLNDINYSHDKANLWLIATPAPKVGHAYPSSPPFSPPSSSSSLSMFSNAATDDDDTVLDAMIAKAELNSDVVNMVAFHLRGSHYLHTGEVARAIDCFLACADYRHELDTRGTLKHNYMMFDPVFLELRYHAWFVGQVYGALDREALAALFSGTARHVSISFYNELLLRYGSNARVYWYRANMHLCLADYRSFVNDVIRCFDLSPEFIPQFVSKHKSYRPDVASLNIWLQRRTIAPMLKQIRELTETAHTVLQVQRGCLSLFEAYFSNIRDEALACEDAAYALTGRADTLRQMGDHEQSTTLINQALQRSPNHTAAHVTKIALLLRKLKWEEAQEMCVALIKSALLSAEALITTELSVGDVLLLAARDIYESTCAVSDVPRCLATFLLLMEKVGSTRSCASAKADESSLHFDQKHGGLDEPNRSARSVLIWELRRTTAQCTALLCSVLHLRAQAFEAGEMLELAIKIDDRCLLAQHTLFLHCMRFSDVGDAFSAIARCASVCPMYVPGVDVDQVMFVQHPTRAFDHVDDASAVYLTMGVLTAAVPEGFKVDHPARSKTPPTGVRKALGHSRNPGHRSRRGSVATESSPSHVRSRRSSIQRSRRSSNASIVGTRSRRESIVNMNGGKFSADEHEAREHSHEHLVTVSSRLFGRYAPPIEASRWGHPTWMKEAKRLIAASDTYGVLYCLECASLMHVKHVARQLEQQLQESEDATQGDSKSWAPKPTAPTKSLTVNDKLPADVWKYYPAKVNTLLCKHVMAQKGGLEEVGAQRAKTPGLSSSAFNVVGKELHTRGLQYKLHLHMPLQAYMDFALLCRWNGVHDAYYHRALLGEAQFSYEDAFHNLSHAIAGAERELAAEKTKSAHHKAGISEVVVADAMGGGGSRSSRKSKSLGKAGDGESHGHENQNDLMMEKRLEMYRLLRAAIAFKVGRFKVCILDCSSVVAVNKENYLAHRQRSLARAVLMQYDDSVHDMEIYYRHNKDHWGTVLRLANSYSYIGKHDEASKVLNKLVEKHASSPDVLYSVALSCFRRHLWKQARDYLDLCIEADPGYLVARSLLGQTLEQEGDYKKAISTYQALALKTHTFPFMHTYIGRAHIHFARQAFRGYLILQRENAEYEAEDARTPSHKTSRPPTRERRERAPSVSSSSDPSHGSQRSLHIFDLSMAAMARKSDTSLESVRFHLQEAVKSLGEAISQQPRDYQAYFLLAYSIFFLNGNRQQDVDVEATVLRYLNHTIKLRNNLASAYFFRACVNLRGAQPLEVVEKDLLKCLQLEPTNALARQSLAYVYLSQGLYDQAFTFYDIMVRNYHRKRAAEAAAGRGHHHDEDVINSTASGDNEGVKYDAKTLLTRKRLHLKNQKGAGPETEVSYYELLKGSGFTASADVAHGSHVAHPIDMDNDKADLAMMLSFRGLARMLTGDLTRAKLDLDNSVEIMGMLTESPSRKPSKDLSFFYLASPGAPILTYLYRAECHRRMGYMDSAIEDFGVVVRRLTTEHDAVGREVLMHKTHSSTYSHRQLSSSQHNMRALAKSVNSTGKDGDSSHAASPSATKPSPKQRENQRWGAVKANLQHVLHVPKIEEGKRAHNTTKVAHEQQHDVESGLVKKLHQLFVADVSHYSITTLPMTAQFFLPASGLTRWHLSSIYNTLGVLLYKVILQSPSAVAGQLRAMCLSGTSLQDRKTAEKKLGGPNLAAADEKGSAGKQNELIKRSHKHSLSFSSSILTSSDRKRAITQRKVVHEEIVALAKKRERAKKKDAVLVRKLPDEEKSDDLRLQSMEYLSMAGNSYEAHFNRGLVLYSVGKYEMALQEFKHAVNVPGTGKANPYVNYGVMVEQMFISEGFDTCYKRAAHFDDSHPIACFNLANAQALKRKYAKAIQSFTQFILRFSTVEEWKEGEVDGDRLGAGLVGSDSDDDEDEGEWEGDAPAPLVASLDSHASGASEAHVLGTPASSASGGQKSDTASVLTPAPSAGPNILRQNSTYSEKRKNKQWKDENHADVNIKRLVAVSYNNRAICYQCLNMNDLAWKGYDKALQLCPDLVFVRFNRAHLFLSNGNCFEALNDISIVRQVRQSKYLDDFVSYCQRYQWGLSVACKDLLRGAAIMPVLNQFDLRFPVLPKTLFDPQRLKLPDSPETHVLEAVIGEIEIKLSNANLEKFRGAAGLENDATKEERIMANASYDNVQGFRDCGRYLEEALKALLLNDNVACYQLLVEASYVVRRPNPYSLQGIHDCAEIYSDLSLSIMEIVALWRARLHVVEDELEKAVADLNMALGDNVRANAAVLASKEHDSHTHSHFDSAPKFSGGTSPKNRTGHLSTAHDEGVVDSDKVLEALPDEVQYNIMNEEETTLLGSNVKLRFSTLLNYKGVLLEALHKQDEALLNYTAALKLNPENVYALINRSRVFRAKGRFKTSINDIMTVLKALHSESKLDENQRGMQECLVRYCGLLGKNPLPHWKQIPVLQGEIAVRVNQSVLEAQAVKQKEETIKSTQLQEKLGDALENYMDELIERVPVEKNQAVATGARRGRAGRMQQKATQRSKKRKRTSKEDSSSSSAKSTKEQEEEELEKRAGEFHDALKSVEQMFEIQLDSQELSKQQKQNQEASIQEVAHVGETSKKKKKKPKLKMLMPSSTSKAKKYIATSSLQQPYKPPARVPDAHRKLAARVKAMSRVNIKMKNIRRVQSRFQGLAAAAKAETDSADKKEGGKKNPEVFFRTLGQRVALDREAGIKEKEIVHAVEAEQLRSQADRDRVVQRSSNADARLLHARTRSLKERDLFGNFETSKYEFENIDELI